MTNIRKLQLFTLLLFLGFVWSPAKGEVIGDSIVVIYNNWMVGDTIRYVSYSSITQIEHSDTIVEESAPIRFEINLEEIRPNGDKIFQTRTQIPVIGDLGRMEPLRPYFERLMNIVKTPQECVTDSMGIIKDFLNYDYFMSEMDTCRAILRAWVDTLDMPEEPKYKLISGMEKSLDISLSKESLLGNIGIFKYYGNAYGIGSISSDVKLPVPFFDNHEVDAKVDFSCDVLEINEDYEIVSFKTFITYNSDQLLDLVASTFLTSQQIHEANLNSPERPYISFIQSEEYLIEALSGTILQVEMENRTTTLEGGQIDYSLIKISD